ncbi:hypothetical protein MTR67_013205 [Solanum verrucosum]|uniref:SWIM-type domain-containing protein n=1 Tax=Solanum verrucosum TaxID=315347 RepID=A0AAF0QCQ5_SOLVR|nr:hypothetical protein MTR67_013205 [Solanum verrucosum]
MVINMVEVTIYFHHGGEWLTSPEPHYDRGCLTYLKGYDPDLISFIDLVNEYINKLGFIGVQELIVLTPTGKYFEIIGDEGVRTLTFFISTEYKFIHLFATEDCELSVDVTDIVILLCMMGHFYFHQLLMRAQSSESEDDSNNGMVFSCSDYDTDELENFVTKKKRNITDGLQDYKEIVKGMAFKDIVEAKQFCKLYALAKKDKLQSDPKYKVKEMKADLHRVFELNVSEAKCKRAKKEILESLEGSFVDSYNKLEGYATELRSCNTGSDIVIDLSKEALSNVRTILPEAHQRYCARHIKANWCKRWGKGELKKLLWWAAWSSFTEEFEDQLQEIKEVNGEAGQDLIDKYPPKAWCRAYLDTVCKNQAVDNNFTESFNVWILEAKYKPIIEMLEDIRVKIIEGLAAKEVVVRKWKDDGFSPKSELLFIEYLKIFKVCKVSGNGDNGYEVTRGADRHIVNLREKKCTCRTWDMTGIPCPHAIKAME